MKAHKHDTPLLAVQALRKGFGENVVLREVSFEVPTGGVVSILGRSGTGKSVLLRCIVGLHQPDAGEIFFKGTSLRADRQPLRSASSYVFQQNALFDSLTVLENLTLPLRTRGELGAKQRESKARELLRQMELEQAAGRYPAQLSGGMQKRLAVARALVTEPQLVFFDEPTAGLDPVRRNAVFEMIAGLQRQRGFTAVVVTHDVAEALLVSSHIVWLDAGEVVFSGTPAQFEDHTEPQFRLFRDNIEILRQTLQNQGAVV